MSRAMDIILTGYNLYTQNGLLYLNSRDVPAKECIEIGLANYMASPEETSLSKAMEIAKLLCTYPQRNLRNDRLSVYANYDWPTMLRKELQYGMDTLTAELLQVKKFSAKL